MLPSAQLLWRRVLKPIAVLLLPVLLLEWTMPARYGSRSVVSSRPGARGHAAL